MMAKLVASPISIHDCGTFAEWKGHTLIT